MLYILYSEKNISVLQCWNTNLLIGFLYLKHKTNWHHEKQFSVIYSYLDIFMMEKFLRGYIFYFSIAPSRSRWRTEKEKLIFSKSSGSAKNNSDTYLGKSFFYLSPMYLLQRIWWLLSSLTSYWFKENDVIFAWFYEEGGFFYGLSRSGKIFRILYGAHIKVSFKDNID